MPIAFDRRTFFDHVRSQTFHGLSDGQVEGCEAILGEAERRGITDARSLAYMLATAFWETGRTMQPVQEAGLGHGRAYGVLDPSTRQAYYGRGLVQLTWKANYARMGPFCGVDLVRDPVLALRLDVAVTIMFEGMIRGLFTGKKLSDYFGAAATDWTGARRIINGTDRAETIAAVAQDFAAALAASARANRQAGVAAAAPTLIDRLKRWIGAQA